MQCSIRHKNVSRCLLWRTYVEVTALSLRGRDRTKSLVTLKNLKLFMICNLGLMELEGELTPILAQMVKSADTNGLLDNAADVAAQQDAVKAQIHKRFEKDGDFSQEDFQVILKSTQAPIYSVVPLKIKDHVNGACHVLYFCILIKENVLQRTGRQRDRERQEERESINS